MKSTTRKQKTAAAPRRSQAERRETTRTRILDATLHCLARYGYAGTGVAQVVARARVSRGAWSHHFASMNALMLAAAQHLMLRVYARLGEVLHQLAQTEGADAQALILGVWREFFASEVNEVYLELLIASRREPGLAQTLAQLSQALEQRLDAVAAQRFESQAGAVVEPVELLMLTRWVLRGIALDEPLLPAGSAARALDAWARLVGGQIRMRHATGKT